MYKESLWIFSEDGKSEDKSQDLIDRMLVAVDSGKEVSIKSDSSLSSVSIDDEIIFRRY
jgi:hypothetical protein